MFERPITFQHPDGSTSPGRVDLYRRGHFVLESKKQNIGTQAKRFDDGLLRAHAQADGYVRALPASEGRPPFLLVVDVGTVIELYAEFSRSGGTYTPFPDPRSHRITLEDLARRSPSPDQGCSRCTGPSRYSTHARRRSRPLQRTRPLARAPARHSGIAGSPGPRPTARRCSLGGCGALSRYAASQQESKEKRWNQ